ncbi:hypothetical protein AM1BK_35330 [Neobacillus kokaensis]|uniref:Uncharacterized protein n=1 Tax=Neobacillus kokaensis TaxID=2759023 RepID=A0ABQ3N807_9BACI|nr:hypothetical protein AM1BK_35330 [Neobacillus kokaensis]
MKDILWISIGRLEEKIEGVWGFFKKSCWRRVIERGSFYHCVAFSSSSGNRTGGLSFPR